MCFFYRCTKWVLQHGRLDDFVAASGLEVTEAAAQVAHFTQPAVHALVSVALFFVDASNA